jgi:hypothetical protein
MNTALDKKIDPGNKTYTDNDRVSDIPIDKIVNGNIFLIGKIIRNLLNTRSEPPKTVIAIDKAIYSILGIKINV